MQICKSHIVFQFALFASSILIKQRIWKTYDNIICDETYHAFSKPIQV